MKFPRKKILLALTILFVAALPGAHAEEPPFGIGLAAGVPHPINLSAEKAFTLDGSGSVSLGSLNLSFPNNIKFGVSNLDVRGRWHPFQGAFFLGGILGFQTLSGSVTQTFQVSTIPVPLTLSAKINSMFLTPHFGWVWGMHSPGLFFGLETGLQIPFASKSTLSVQANDPSQAPYVNLAEQTQAYQDLQAKLEDIGNKIGLIRFPYASIRIGWMFR